MIVHVPMLVLAVALLWFPRTWLRRGATLWRTRRRGIFGGGWANPPKDGRSLGFGREFTRARNYIDCFRALAGALALYGGFGVEAVLRAPPNALPGAAQKVLAVQTAILLIGVLIQTVRYERSRLTLSAPVFYIAGLSFVVFTPFAGLCGFVIAWAVNPIAPNVQAFLIVHSCVAIVVAYFLAGLTIPALLGFALCWTPIVLSLLTRRPLVVFSARLTTSGRDAMA